MNAKHVKLENFSRGGLKRKIFCVLLAVMLLALMVPNGLRANAAEKVEVASASETVQQQDATNAKNEEIPFNVSLSFDAVSQDYGSTNGYFNVYAGHYTGDWIYPTTDLIECFEKDTSFYEDELIADAYYDTDYLGTISSISDNNGMGRLNYSADFYDPDTDELTCWETTITPINGPIGNSNETISSFLT